MTGYLRSGSLFSGVAGLDLAVEQVFGARPAWFCDNDPAATRVLAHRFPDVANLGDITTVDWADVAPVDLVTGGSPCQDVSAAGKRAGMYPGTRSGLWAHMTDAIQQLRPRYVVFENVRGLGSACAENEMGPCPGCLDKRGPHRPFLRALGRVLGDLADLRYDAVWCGLPASGVGAPHERFRFFVLALDTVAHTARRTARRVDPISEAVPGT
jgi:DNA (cytosine-5)-methyltransferase 1